MVPGAAREDWALDDPKGRPIDDVRCIRDAIQARVRELLEREGWSAARARERDEGTAR